MKPSARKPSASSKFRVRPASTYTLLLGRTGLIEVDRPIVDKFLFANKEIKLLTRKRLHSLSDYKKLAEKIRARERKRGGGAVGVILGRVDSQLSLEVLRRLIKGEPGVRQVEDYTFYNLS